jgi:hypothetical protein
MKIGKKNVMWEGSFASGLLRSTRGKFGFRENWQLKPPRERPRGGGGIYRNGVWGHQPLSVIPEEAHFHGKSLDIT